jgi:hypothetical protein
MPRNFIDGDKAGVTSGEVTVISTHNHSRFSTPWSLKGLVDLVRDFAEFQRKIRTYAKVV